MSLYNQKMMFSEIDKRYPKVVDWCMICDQYTGSRENPCTGPEWPLFKGHYPSWFDLALENEPGKCPHRSLKRYTAEKVMERLAEAAL
jgi:hypothetical protein